MATPSRTLSKCSSQCKGDPNSHLVVTITSIIYIVTTDNKGWDNWHILSPAHSSYNRNSTPVWQHIDETNKRTLLWLVLNRCQSISRMLTHLNLYNHKTTSSPLKEPHAGWISYFLVSWMPGRLIIIRLWSIICVWMWLTISSVSKLALGSIFIILKLDLAWVI